MRSSRLLVATAGSVLLVSTLGAVPATAEDPAPPGPAVRSAPESRTPGSLTAQAARAAAAEDEVEGALRMPTSYPVQPKLRIYPEPDSDAADRAELTGYDDIAPRLNAAMRGSDRISTQIVGESTAGRQLYLVTVTSPEEEDETARQTAWRRKIRTNPAAAAADATLQRDYKTPIWITANIHGNEWEGTDAALDYIEQLGSAPWNDVKGLLDNHRLYFTVTLNPDGRTLGQRPTALNLDENRDMITNTTPESASFVRTAHAVQALYVADFHGYTGVLQVEPCGPPHGDDYEYDLFIPHGYAAALQIERDVVDAEIEGNTYYNVVTGEVVEENTGPDTDHIAIPYRDTPTGWDDYPPIFTAQYAAFTGAVTSTIELPRSRPNANSQTPANARVNRAVALRAMQSLVDYVNDNDAAMLDDQVEFFRRANVGAERVALTEANIAAVPGPDQWKPLWDASDNQVPVQYPRAFVISVGPDQRSVSDARFLVSRLLLHHIVVRRLDAAATLGGTRYPAGSYVVDMHQPNRNLAHSLLATGSDISNHPGIMEMYDISAWSWGRLWGADVEAVGTTGTGSLPASTRVTSGDADGTVARGGSHLTFELAGVNDFRALNALLEQGVKVSQLADGSAIVAPGGRARQAVTKAAREFDIDVDRASAAEIGQVSDGSAKGLKDLRIAYTGNQNDLLSLTQLGFDDLIQVTGSILGDDPTILQRTDLLWLGRDLTFGPGDEAGLAAMEDFVERGGDVVGYASSAFNTAVEFGLLDGDAAIGNELGNGIVAVDTPSGGVLSPYAQSHAFVYPATWFTNLPPSVRVEQTYAAGNPLVAGHWRDTDGSNGPTSAAGRAAAVSAVSAAGSRAFVFGTSPFFRTHPKGGQSQAARAIFWAAPEGAGVPATVATDTSLQVRPVSRYPSAVVARVVVRATEGTAEGVVEVREGSKVLARRTLGASGALTIPLKGLRPGTHRIRAVFVPAEDSGFVGSASGRATVKVLRAISQTSIRAEAKGQGRVRVVVAVRAGNVRPTGTVRIKVGGKARTVKVVDGRAKVVIKVAKGQRKVTATYRGSALVAPSTAPSRTVRVR